MQYQEYVITSYSIHYTKLYDSKNESLVIDDKNMSLMFGKMMFEEFFVSKIPRVFYQNKPKDFGQFYLAEKYYPDRFDMDTGSPSFGKAIRITSYNVCYTKLLRCYSKPNIQTLFVQFIMDDD